MGPKLPHITAVELLRVLKRDGWQAARQSGSHLVLKHPKKTGRVIVPVHASVTLKPKTLLSILKQAELTIDDLSKLL
jgi:predicted RNA binding protein YcfA (HicA-like mRNA interferase family)